MGLKNINLFGPKGLKNFLEACRYFFQRPDMTFRIREFEDTDFFQDENLKIIPIILNPQKSDVSYQRVATNFINANSTDMSAVLKVPLFRSDFQSLVGRKDDLRRLRI